jgi:hypothetical protein
MEENSTPPDSESPGPGPADPTPAKPARPATLLRVGSPDTVLAVIPGLLGFHPSRSMVVVGAGPPRGRIQVVFRYDLPEPPDAGAAAKIAAHAAAVLARHQLTLAIAVGYGTGPMVTPVVDALVRELRRADITLHDTLRVDSGRYWSYSCLDPRCCPAEGVPFDLTAHPAAAAMSAAGNKALRDRAALAATIAPLGGLAEESMREATRHAERHAADLIREGTAAGGRSGAVERVIAEGLRAVGEAIVVYRGGGQITEDDRLAWLAVSLADVRVRDDAWARMVPGQVQAHLRLWTDLVRRVPARYAPAPASLLAFTAWQAGNGALANVAAQRALAADPEYSMAMLILEAIGAGIPPSAARLPMSPEEVAASYAQTAPGKRPEPDPTPEVRDIRDDRGSREAGEPRAGRKPGEAGDPYVVSKPGEAGDPRAVSKPGEAGDPRAGRKPGEAGQPRGAGKPREPRGGRGASEGPAGRSRPGPAGRGPSGHSRKRARRPAPGAGSPAVPGSTRLGE